MMNNLYNSDESDDSDSNQNQTQVTAQLQIQSFQGPNISNFNLSKLPIGNNGRPRYAVSLYDQGSYTREKRDTSPMSLQHQNFQHSMYRGAMSSQRSMKNNRFGSSMSVQSFGSNVTLSAEDIIQKVKNGEFSGRDMRKIIDACMKKRVLKKIEKRRNKKLSFLRKSRRRSSYDLGEPSDESSGSSDEVRSVRTCRTANPDYNSVYSYKSATTDYTDIRGTIQKTNLYNDCTENFRQNAFRSLISFAPKYVQKHVNHQKPSSVSQRSQHCPPLSQKERFGSGFLLPSQKFNQSVASSLIPEHPHKQNIVEHCNLEGKNSKNHARIQQLESDSESDEIFSSNTTVERSIPKPNGFQSKRDFSHSNDDNDSLPQKKRSRLASPQKMIDVNKISQQQNESNTDRKTCDFVFAKPQLPLRKPVLVNKSLKLVQSNEIPLKKSTTKTSNEVMKQSNEIPVKKTTTKTSNAVMKLMSNSSPPKAIISPEPQPAEQLIAMSSQPLDDVMVPDPDIMKNLPSHSPQGKDHINQSDSTQLSTTDMSMRPSFIKRKLFTQKADIAENKNAGSDTIEENSPHCNMYSMIQKEKSRTRKLVTSQSCLNRDLGDESNLLDLIHKIVPANQMNLTTATKTDKSSRKSKPENSTCDKWDVSLAVTKCNIDEESDTYTDEEIFHTKETVVKSKANNTHTAGTDKDKYIANKFNPPIIQPEENQSTKINQDYKLKTDSKTAGAEKQNPNHAVNKLKFPISQVKPPEENQDIYKIRALKCVKSFWYSDGESDAETVKNPGKKTITGITSNNGYKMNPVHLRLEDLSAKNITCNSTNDAERHTMEKKCKSKTNTNSASSNSKQKKHSKDKSVFKSPPRKKQVQNTKTKNIENSEKPVAKENKTVKDRAVQKTQEKAKSNKNVSSDVNNVELNNKNLSNSSRETTFSYDEDIYKKIRNKTPRIRLCRKLRCCDVPPKNFAVDNNTQPLTKSLRNREVDLSTTASSGLDTTLKDVPKRKGRPRQNEAITKTFENKENVSNLSDLSFTLSLNTTVMTRRMRSKNIGDMNDNRKRLSDVSFSLVSDGDKFNKTGMTTRSSFRSRNVTKQK